MQVHQVWGEDDPPLYLMSSLWVKGLYFYPIVITLHIYIIRQLHCWHAIIRIITVVFRSTVVYWIVWQRRALSAPCWSLTIVIPLLYAGLRQLELPEAPAWHYLTAICTYDLLYNAHHRLFIVMYAGFYNNVYFTCLFRFPAEMSVIPLPEYQTCIKWQQQTTIIMIISGQS